MLISNDAKISFVKDYLEASDSHKFLNTDISLRDYQYIYDLITGGTAFSSISDARKLLSAIPKNNNKKEGIYRRNKNIVFSALGLKGGGAERQITLLANLFDAAGYQITILIPSSPYKPHYEINAGIDLLFLGHGVTTLGYKLIMHSLRPDCVIHFTLWAVLPLSDALKEFNIPFILSVRNDMRFVNQQQYSRDNKIAIKDALELAQLIVTQREDIRSQLPIQYRFKTTVIPNVIDVFDQPSINIKTSKQIIYIANFSPRKNHSILIKAFSKILTKHPDWQLSLVGSGDMSSAVSLVNSLKINASVNFTGQLSPIQVKQRIEQSSISVFPSKFEGFPNGLAEAIAQGLPAISFRDIAHPLIEDEVSGFLIDRSSPEQEIRDLSQKLDSLISSPKLRQSMSNAAIKLMQKFQPNVVFNQWQSLVESAVQALDKEMDLFSVTLEQNFSLHRPTVPSDNQPLVSVGIPVYNAGGSPDLVKCLNSVINQTYRNLEIIIVDDGSTDDTVRLLAEYSQKDSRIKLVQLEQNKGRPSARNVVLRHFNGHFLAWLDADDYWHHQKIERQLAFTLDAIKKYSNKDILTLTDSIIFNKRRSTYLKYAEDISQSTTQKSLLEMLLAGHITLSTGLVGMFSRELIQKTGFFDEKMLVREDIDYQIRMLSLENITVKSLHEPLGVRNHDFSEEKQIVNITYYLKQIEKHIKLYNKSGENFKKRVLKQIYRRVIKLPKEAQGEFLQSKFLQPQMMAESYSGLLSVDSKIQNLVALKTDNSQLQAGSASHVHSFDVVFVIPRIFKGGSEKALLQASKACSESGLRTCVCTFEEPGEVSPYNIPKNVSLIQIIAPTHFGYFLDQYRPRSLFFFLPFETKEAQDIAKKEGYPYGIIHNHDPSSFFTNASQRSKINEIELNASLIVARHDKITISEGNQKKTIIIYPTILADPVKVPGAVTEKKTLLCVGRLVDYKRVEMVIRTFSDLRTTENNWKLVIAGDGRHKQSVLDAIEMSAYKSDIEYIGFVENTSPLYQQAEILVSASTTENFSFVQCEALVNGCPIVVFDHIPSNHIMVGQNERGILVPKGQNEGEDFENLKVAVFELMKNVRLRKKLSNNSRGFQKMVGKNNLNQWSIAITELINMEPENG